MTCRPRRSKKNPKIVKNLYQMKLRHTACRCCFCHYLYSAEEEINRLNAITKEQDYFESDEVRYIDTLLWKENSMIVCNRCSDCLGGASRRYMKEWKFELHYKLISQKLL